MSSVYLSVTLVDHDRIGWKSWKLIARTISPTSSLFVAQRSSTCSQGNTDKFWGENVCWTPTSRTSGGIESTESHVILGGGVAVCLFTFVGASRGHVCDSTALLFILSTFICRVVNPPAVMERRTVISMFVGLCVCLSVCLSASISHGITWVVCYSGCWTKRPLSSYNILLTCPNFSTHVASALLCTSGFVDDVMFP